MLFRSPLPLEFPQSRSFTWNLGRVLLHIGVWDFLVVVSRGTEVRLEFRSAFVKGYCMPEIPNTTIEDREWKAVRN